MRIKKQLNNLKKLQNAISKVEESGEMRSIKTEKRIDEIESHGIVYKNE